MQLRRMSADHRRHESHVARVGRSGSLRETDDVCIEGVGDEGGVVVPLFNNYVMGFSQKVAHDTMGGNWTLDGLKGLERWWFA